MSKRDYNRNPNLGGAGRLLYDDLDCRSPTNERDLALAIRARDQLRSWQLALLQQRRPARAQGEMFNIAKGIVYQLQNRPVRCASPRQLAFLLKILKLDAPPAPVDPHPINQSVLPKEPPGGRRYNFGP